MTKNEFDHEMRKMDRRDKERSELASHNFGTSVQNALRLLYSYLDGSIYIRCKAGVGYEDYLVEVSNPGDMAGHKAECLYMDTDGGFGMHKAKAHSLACREASMYADEEIPVVETDRAKLKEMLKTLLSKSQFDNMKDFVEHFLPENLESYNLDLSELA